MAKPVAHYHQNQDATQNVVQESPAPFMKSFSSQEEAELHRLKKNLAMSDMERFRKFCRLMRIGKMLTPQNANPLDK